MWGSSVPSAQGRADSAGSTAQPLMLLPLHQDEGEAGAFSIQKCHPQLLWTISPSPPAPFNPHSYTDGKRDLSIRSPPGCS